MNNNLRMKILLVGGFLGSGKTTAIVQACEYLMRENKRVAVITNDQGDQQVDGEYVASLGIDTVSVSNGCFCCKYEMLDECLRALEEDSHPDFVFAESVGSCTDLVATVAKPLVHFRPSMDIAICIFADAAMLAAWIEGSAAVLDDSVQYIYKKQLAEADVIVVNKTDTITPGQLALVDRVLHAEYGDKTILHQNSLRHADVVRWLQTMSAMTVGPRKSLLLDYSIYGEGEARMAWLDMQLVLDAPLGNGAYVVQHLVSSIFNALRRAQLPIGHLKFFVDAGNWKEKISFTTASTSGEVRFGAHNVRHVRLLVNARVQTEPERLRQLTTTALKDIPQSDHCTLRVERESSFSPGFPKPTYRLA